MTIGKADAQSLVKSMFVTAVLAGFAPFKKAYKNFGTNMIKSTSLSQPTLNQLNPKIISDFAARMRPVEMQLPANSSATEIMNRAWQAASRTATKVTATTKPQQGAIQLAKRVASYVRGENTKMAASLALGYWVGRVTSKKEKQPQIVINNTGPSFFDDHALLAAGTAAIITCLYRA